MYRQCRVMVTGAGSGVGQGIVKALRICDLPVTVVAADIAPMNAALYRADEAIIIPRVEQANVLEHIIELLLLHRIDVVMVGSEFDLEFFSLNREEIEKRASVTTIVATPATVAIANDKWLTAEFLRELCGEMGVPCCSEGPPWHLFTTCTYCQGQRKLEETVSRNPCTHASAGN